MEDAGEDRAAAGTRGLCARNCTEEDIRSWGLRWRTQGCS